MKEIENGTEIIPGWEAVRVIGGGGFGKVYEVKKVGYEESDSCHSAMKVISIPQSPEEYDSLRDDGFDEESITTIFKSRVDDIASEFKMMQQFKGVTNIVSYEDHEIVQHEDKRGWDVIIRMEMLTSLPASLEKRGMSEKDVVRLGIGICSALELCGQKKIIHRDIKPQNVFINEFGDYKLGDFGIAKTMDHTTRATKIGTSLYIAPEVYLGKPYDAKIDQYSLGLLMYWLLNERRLPFLPLPPEIPKMSQQEEAMGRRLRGEAVPRPKNGSDELIRIVLRACAYEPSERYGSPSEMKAALQSILARSDEKPIVGFDASEEETKDGCPPADDGTEASPKDPEKTVGLFDYKTDKQENEGADKTMVLPYPAMNANGGEKTEVIDPEKTVGLYSEQAEKPVAMQRISELKSDPSGKPICEPDGEGKPKSAQRQKRVLLQGQERDHEKENGREQKQDRQEKKVFQNSIQEHPAKQKKKTWLLLVFLLLAIALIGATILILSKTVFSADGFASKRVSSIQVETGPEIREYRIDEMLKTDGLTLTVQYSNGESETIRNGFFCDPMVFTETGSVEVTVSYEGKSTSFFVTVEKSYFVYNEVGEGYEVVSFDSFFILSDIHDISIPYMHNEKPVVSIGKDAFRDCSNMKSVSIPSSVTLIGDNAFYNCSNLSDVLIADSVKTIGYEAFSGCVSLTEITIPNSVTSIGDRAFQYCMNLTDIKVENGNANYCSDGGVLFNKGMTKLIAFPEGKKGAYTVPDGVESIEEYAFSYCYNLTEVAIPGQLKVIHFGAFYDCNGLKSISLPDSVKEIGGLAFSGCSALETVLYAGTEKQWESISIANGNGPLTSSFKTSS